MRERRTGVIGGKTFGGGPGNGYKRKGGKDRVALETQRRRKRVEAYLLNGICEIETKNPSRRLPSKPPGTACPACLRQSWELGGEGEESGREGGSGQA